MYGCLESFRMDKKLDKENTWYCNICKDHVQATKKIELYTVPPILVFCLQRFKSANIYYKDKLEDLISYPVEGLNMTPYVVSEDLKSKSDLIYDLYAVSNHYGTLNFGHYTAIAKNHYNGKWYDYNDS